MVFLITLPLPLVSNFRMPLSYFYIVEDTDYKICCRIWPAGISGTPQGTVTWAGGAQPASLLLNTVHFNLVFAF